MKEKPTKLQQKFLNSLSDDWYVPFNGVPLGAFENVFDLCEELEKLGYLEKEKMSNGFVKFRKIK